MRCMESAGKPGRKPYSSSGCSRAGPEVGCRATMEAAPSAAPATASRTSFGRRTYVIDRGFQLKYTLMLVVLGAAMSALFGAMMYLAHLDAQRELPMNALLEEQLRRSEVTLITLMIAITVLMAAALALVGILITHRVAGPVYVMSHYMTTLARGRYPHIRPLRKQDELKTFFDRFHDAIEAMRAREVEEADALGHAISVLTPLATTEESRKALAELTTVQERKRDATDRLSGGR